VKPAWESGAKPAVSRVSSNIKAGKRKVAALFKTQPAEPQETAPKEQQES